MMRHLVEVMMVVEGNQGWAREVRDRRCEQGMPLPSVSFDGDGGGGGYLMEGMVKELDKTIVRLIVSFI